MRNGIRWIREEIKKCRKNLRPRRSFADSLQEVSELSHEDIEQSLFDGLTQEEFCQKYLNDL